MHTYICLHTRHRCKQFLAPLKRAAPNSAAGAEGLADARVAGTHDARSLAEGGVISSVPCSPLLSMAVVSGVSCANVMVCGCVC